MKRFWDGIIKSILDGINPNKIIEIGVDKGENTKNILEYCSKNNCDLISIDPNPDSSVIELEYEYKERFKLFRDLSLNVLSDLEEAQVYLIDGDHNWYTVYHELLTIQNKSKELFPLIFLHDIEWPYDKRDLYYNPKNIPPKYRHEYAKKGIELYSTKLIEEGGYNSSFNNALVSGTEKNGVLTAIIDFLNQSHYDLKFIKIKGFHGLGIIYDKNLYLQNQNFKKSIDNLKYSLNKLESYINSLSNVYYENINEIAFLRGMRNLNDSLLKEKGHLEREKEKLKKRNLILEKHLRYYKISNRNKEKEIKSLYLKLKSLKLEYGKLNNKLNELIASFYETNYLHNIGRPLKQILISTFPAFYILLRMNDNLKNKLITIKGYKSIKKNRLLDIGYYLKKYSDVRKSGMDPLIHYIFYGYKEGRNPSALFDTNYYLRYSDVNKSKINPLIHYSLYGIKEGRKTNNEQRSTQFLSNKKKFKDKYDFSIILTTANQTDIIERTIDSVLKQTFRNYELIIVDYGITSKTKKFINKKYKDHLKKSRIKYLKTKNRELNSARNEGLKKARGNVIAYLDANIYWSNNYLEKIAQLFRENNFNTAYSVIELDDRKKNKKCILDTKYDRKKLLNANFINLNVFVHKRFLYHQLGGFDESLGKLASWDLILRYTRLNEPYFLSEVLVKLFISANSEDTDGNLNLKESSEIKKLHLAELIEKGLDNLRIGYVLWDFPTFSQTFVINELRWLVENHYDVKVFYKIKPDKEASLDFNIESFQIQDESDLIEKIIEFDINILHTHFVYPAGTLLTYPAAEKTKTHFTISAHAVDIFQKKRDKKNKIGEISQSRYCKRVFIPGKFHYEYLLKRGVPEEKLMIISQATDYKIEQKINMKSPRLKRDIKNVVTIARFVEKKGIDTLINAAKILKDEEIFFKIFGYGPLEEDLRNKIAELNLKNITIENAIESKDELKKTYENADIFVLPCKKASDGDMDGIPTVIFESMAYGVPVITTTISCIPEYVIDNYSGFTVDPDDSLSLANKIKYVKDMKKEQIFSILKNAQNQVQKVSNVQETIETMLDIWMNKKIDLFMVTYQKNEYKNLKTIKEILNRIFKHTTTEFNLTIIDNDSDLDFKYFILEYAESHPNIRIIFLKSNLQCGPASNVALEVMDRNFAIYICSNEGFIIKHGWERKALHYMENHENVAIAGSLAYSPSYYDGKTYKKQPFFKKFRNKEYVINKDNVKFRHVQGGAYILRKEAYNQCGGFNSLLPQDHMDVEYSYYLESMGWKLGKINEWISITKKTRPDIYAFLDEYTSLVHPLKVEELSQIKDMALKHCNICKGKIIGNICQSCNSDNSERTIYRIVGLSDKIHRSLKCTLLLKHNTLHKTLGKLFKLTKKYSTKSINEDVEEILKNLEQTDVLITNINFTKQNFKKTLSTMIEKLTEKGLLIVQLSLDESLNNKIREFLIENRFTINTMEFKSQKLNNNEFLVAEWLHE
ncbi:MAG: hypothetical protein Kow0019_19380 [Methanobacteriaceae archaeon]